MRKLLAILLLLPVISLAQTAAPKKAATKAKASGPGPVVVTPDKIQWGPAPAVFPLPVPVPADPPPVASFPLPEPPPSAALCPRPVPAFEATSVAALAAREFSCPVAGEVEGVPFVFPGVSEFGFNVPPGAIAKRPRASPAGMLAPGEG